MRYGNIIMEGGKQLRLPQFTAEERDRLLPTPVEATVIYNKTSKSLEIFTGDQWVPLGKGSEPPFYHIQEAPSKDWVIRHRRGDSSPDVIVFDDMGSQVFAEVTVVDEDNVKVSFSKPLVGRAKVS